MMDTGIARPRAGLGAGFGSAARVVAHASTSANGCRPQAVHTATGTVVHLHIGGTARTAGTGRPRGCASPDGTPRRIRRNQPRPVKGRLEDVVHLPAGPIRSNASANMVCSTVAIVHVHPLELLTAPATLYGTSVVHVPIITAALVSPIVGVGATPVVTPQRIQAPQPLPQGRIGGVVHLPAGTTGVEASAPRNVARLSILPSTRLGRWQPRHNGRLAIPLQLPLQDDVTTTRAGQHVRLRLSRQATAYPSTNVLESVSPSVAALADILGDVGFQSRITGVVNTGVLRGVACDRRPLKTCTNPPSDLLDTTPSIVAATADSREIDTTNDVGRTMCAALQVRCSSNDGTTASIHGLSSAAGRSSRPRSGGVSLTTGSAAPSAAILRIHLAESSSMSKRVLVKQVIRNAVILIAACISSGIQFGKHADFLASARCVVCCARWGAKAGSDDGAARRCIPNSPKATTRLARFVESGGDDDVGPASVTTTAKSFPPGMFPFCYAGERHAPCWRGPAARSQKIPRPPAAPCAAAGAKCDRNNPRSHGDIVPSGAPFISTSVCDVAPAPF